MCYSFSCWFLLFYYSHKQFKFSDSKNDKYKIRKKHTPYTLNTYGVHILIIQLVFNICFRVKKILLTLDDFKFVDKSVYIFNTTKQWKEHFLNIFFSKKL